MKDILNFINGEYVKNASGKTYEKRNPIDNSLIGMVYEAGKPEVDAAVAAAKAALHGPWGKLSVAERCNMLDGLADEINRRFDDFLQAEMADTGKPAQPGVACGHPARRGQLQDLHRHDQERLDRVVRDDHARTARRRCSYAVRVPRGVIAMICPWNLPLLLMTWKVGPGAGLRQHRGRQAVGGDAEHGHAARRGDEQGRRAEGCLQRRARLRPRLGRRVPDPHPGVNGITFTGETRPAPRS